jgi:hypothetical protein
MARAKSRTQTCTAAEARIRLDHARLYIMVADLVLTQEPSEATTVATGNAVLAAIAATDAICCAATGSRFRGQDHHGAAEYLANVTGDERLSRLLRDVLNVKDLSHYGLDHVVVSKARSALRKAQQLVAEAERRVR